MKAFINVNPKDLKEAASLLQQASKSGKSAAVVAGGSDLLGMVKERLIQPDVLVNLKSIPGMYQIAFERGRVSIGGLVSLDTIANDPLFRENYAVLAEAAGQVGSPQIRNAGTISGNVLQRPWCWYYRNGFQCFKNGGKTCFSVTGENEFHAIFGGGPSYIVHPSDTAPALVALDAKFRIVGPAGERIVAAADFFKLPADNPARENSLANDEVLAEIQLPAAKDGVRSTYYKVMDRESWTHAVVSVALILEMDQQTCRNARVVLGGVAPIPWRVPKVEAMLAGQRVTADLAAEAGAAAVEGARPLAKNQYKIPLTQAVVKQTLLTLSA